MIPKKLHYCWFGGNPLPELALKCIESWHKYCPEYEIIRWDESNCDMTTNQFVKQAYELEKWAFVSDYYRLKIIEKHGGIYLDIDVELLRPLDNLLELEGFMGFELSEDNFIATGLGFGAIANHPVITKLRKNYEYSPFIKANGELDTLPCPQRDTQVLLTLGLALNNQLQTIKGITFFPSDYFSPIGFMGEKNFTNNTYSIHHFNASWHSDEIRKLIKTKKKILKIFGVKTGRKINLLISTYKELKEKGIKKTFKKIKQKIFNL